MITTILSIILLPLLLLGNYLTGHFGFIFVLDILFLISLFVVCFSIYVIANIDSPKFAGIVKHDQLEKIKDARATWRKYISYIFWTVTGSYFLWKEFYVSALILLIYVIMLNVLFIMAKEAYAQYASKTDSRG